MDELPVRKIPREADERSLTEVVPTRAVLTELARGFLLVHESNPDRARAFAKTFLLEREGTTSEVRIEPVRQVTLARLALGRNPQGAVEPSPSRMPR
ncbi:MAG: hypothetical protein L3K02_02815 [Thermoplasmata archaeon]|nr:hypothetical protein [Thermoplasmata archaeon]